MDQDGSEMQNILSFEYQAMNDLRPIEDFLNSDLTTNRDFCQSDYPQMPRLQSIEVMYSENQHKSSALNQLEATAKSRKVKVMLNSVYGDENMDDHDSIQEYKLPKDLTNNSQEDTRDDQASSCIKIKSTILNDKAVHDMSNFSFDEKKHNDYCSFLNTSEYSQVQECHDRFISDDQLSQIFCLEDVDEIISECEFSLNEFSSDESFDDEDASVFQKFKIKPSNHEYFVKQFRDLENLQEQIINNHSKRIKLVPLLEKVWNLHQILNNKQFRQKLFNLNQLKNNRQLRRQRLNEILTQLINICKTKYNFSFSIQLILSKILKYPHAFIKDLTNVKPENILAELVEYQEERTQQLINIYSILESKTICNLPKDKILELMKILDNVKLDHNFTINDYVQRTEKQKLKWLQDFFQDILCFSKRDAVQLSEKISNSDDEYLINEWLQSYLDKRNEEQIKKGSKISKIFAGQQVERKCRSNDQTKQKQDKLKNRNHLSQILFKENLQHIWENIVLPYNKQIVHTRIQKTDQIFGDQHTQNNDKVYLSNVQHSNCFTHLLILQYPEVFSNFWDQAKKNRNLQQIFHELTEPNSYYIPRMTIKDLLHQLVNDNSPNDPFQNKKKSAHYTPQIIQSRKVKKLKIKNLE